MTVYVVRTRNAQFGLGAFAKSQTSRAPFDGAVVAGSLCVRIGLAPGVLLFLTACPVGWVADEEIDSGNNDDGGTSGVTITWSCAPDVPGPVGASVLVDEMRFEASSLRLIGDSAPPGDPRTTRAPIEVRWYEGNRPQDVGLDNAPSGLYSRIELGVGGSDEHLEIRGQAFAQGAWRDFDIDDQRQHAIMNDIALALAPGQRATIPVTIELAVIVAAVPFDELQDEGDGTLVFADNDPRLDAVWAAVDAAIRVPTSFAVEETSAHDQR